MAFELPPLPYDTSALEPHMSAQTLEFHHGKHHNTYVTNLNNMTKDTPMADMALEDVIMKAWADKNTGVFNNAAQVWNHTFFWNGMKAGGGGAPTGAIKDKIDEAFGSFDKFKDEFKAGGAGQFGSGWVWLVLENGTLKIAKTPNAELPMINGQIAILTCDVWEHAYYLDYQNRRPDFLSTFLENLVNWDFANENLAKAT
ncbi:superoxide dismutase [Roseospira marina]|uniref:Superoxide dismutase n=1 Tax=Roseospira marina TaxID=140057 RepID=A0A5M6IIA5_9PROT|nr:superoxide dismutase [Roseospira marina]KAA5607589.1 superoxide dismutase [Roseospira marina]MBB4312219.1 Fe-Mn family superoxide dismutase [Roseospira marina]MBB5085765.1 Fe-Mn family superoxide dismutase [Roseospira marina]